jgi:hypothetical protein
MVKSPVRLDDGMLLVAHGTTLLGYNSSAYWIWSALATGQNPGEVAAALAAEFEIEPARATEEVNTILSHWREIGVLDSESATLSVVESLPDIDLAHDVQWSASWLCQFGGRLVEFAVEDPAAATHLRVALSSLEMSGGTPETRIEVRTAGDETMYVRRDGEPFRRSEGGRLRGAHRVPVARAIGGHADTRGFRRVRRRGPVFSRDVRLREEHTRGLPLCAWRSVSGR